MTAQTPLAHPVANIAMDTGRPLPGDRLVHALQARYSAGLGPEALALPYLDWLLHMANAPFRRMQLAGEAAVMAASLPLALSGRTLVEPQPGDHRFSSPSWKLPPFNLISQAFLMTERWWDDAANGAPGMDPLHARIVDFAARQWLDMVSPSNAPWLNPEVLARTAATGGMNFVAGAGCWMDDLKALAFGRDTPDALKVGRDLATTPGQVIYRNALMELIQYAPATTKVRPEPVLITPAWIMKYYVLDLSRQNSLVRWLTEQGFTVFCISWRNPGAEMRDVGFDDYRSKGVMTAMDVVSKVRPGVKIHACGYCLGGTILSVAAAAMARDHDDRLASLTLFCTQTDFTEAGELQLFTTPAEVAFLDDLMWRNGYLSGSQMAGAFQLLRSNDLIWSRSMKRYFLGERDDPSDLMTWNADVTRLPYRMHAEYLHHFFLDNDFAEGRFRVAGRAVSFADVDAPMFVVGTETDHVSPWRSVFKAHLLNSGDLTFVLTTGGHNAGVVNPPGHPSRSYRLRHRRRGDRYLGPDEWCAKAKRRDGSWWPAWTDWLKALSGEPVAAPQMGAPEAGVAPIEPAPGAYVLER